VLHCVREALPLADFIEVNESCPNVHHGRRGIYICTQAQAHA
jgi:dihydroorotate dehydrogenase